uniref:Mitochondrial carrier protein n=1 Tax=Chromera velia CCMP2878 TaxID=1169474 RepID=A0A0G4ICT3_9ALVE|eukprot:Cvel_13243.t1-p1 / transcript=Cvel_13243.t1 / gene=Cvel_13243 / organism=Chromera_velia_CCMP2878 / gene_product=Solute carrier family 25 member 36, putative / transcript_product=Solute carrier family 25 member 36, putative / location=Cvel_scaffold897:55932-59418(+) / protein_length=716 / sequence_SO=supercontig / SO=protein_coding / is_pseudo=false
MRGFDILDDVDLQLHTSLIDILYHETGRRRSVFGEMWTTVKFVAADIEQIICLLIMLLLSQFSILFGIKGCTNLIRAGFQTLFETGPDGQKKKANELLQSPWQKARDPSANHFGKATLTLMAVLVLCLMVPSEGRHTHLAAQGMSAVHPTSHAPFPWHMAQDVTTKFQKIKSQVANRALRIDEERMHKQAEATRRIQPAQANQNANAKRTRDPAKDSTSGGGSRVIPVAASLVHTARSLFPQYSRTSSSADQPETVSPPRGKKAPRWAFRKSTKPGAFANAPAGTGASPTPHSAQPFPFRRRRDAAETAPSPRLFPAVPSLKSQLDKMRKSIPSAEQVQRQAASLVAGGLAGGIAATLTNPLDVIKTQLQSAGKGDFWSVAQRILQSPEGARGLFRGLTPTLVGIIPARATYFWGYSTGRAACMKKWGDCALTHILTAVAAGMTAYTVTNPIFMVRTRLQLMADAQAGQVVYRGWMDATRHIWETEGLGGFFKGVVASYWGVSEGCIHWLCYEQFRKKWMQLNKMLSSDGKLSAEFDDKMTPVQTFVSAGLAKMAASAATYPHEVIRTRLREQAVNGVFKYKTFGQSARLILAEEGLGGLYAGLGPHLARVVPSTAILIASYELINCAINTLMDERREQMALRRADREREAERERAAAVKASEMSPVTVLSKIGSASSQKKNNDLGRASRALAALVRSQRWGAGAWGRTAASAAAA